MYVCLQTIYGLNPDVFLSTLLHCLILTGAWFGALSRVCLHAYYPIYCLCFCPPGFVHLYVKCCQSITAVDCFSPPKEHECEYECAFSRRVHAPT